MSNPKDTMKVTEKDSEIWAIKIADQIKPYKWDNKKPTIQMLGRWQPWHEGHYALFKEIIKKTGQVNIMVKDVKGIGDNPFDFKTVKKKIENALKELKNSIKNSLVPKIKNKCYGRKVGYKTEKINLPKNSKNFCNKDRNRMRMKKN